MPVVVVRSHGGEGWGRGLRERLGTPYSSQRDLQEAWAELRSQAGPPSGEQEQFITKGERWNSGPSQPWEEQRDVAWGWVGPLRSYLTCLGLGFLLCNLGI